MTSNEAGAVLLEHFLALPSNEQLRRADMMLNIMKDGTEGADLAKIPNELRLVMAQEFLRFKGWTLVNCFTCGAQLPSDVLVLRHRACGLLKMMCRACDGKRFGGFGKHFLKLHMAGLGGSSICVCFLWRSFSSWY